MLQSNGTVMNYVPKIEDYAAESEGKGEKRVQIDVTGAMNEEKQHGQLKRINGKSRYAGRHHALMGLKNPTGVQGRQKQGEALYQEQGTDRRPGKIESRNTHKQCVD